MLDVVEGCSWKNTIQTRRRNKIAKKLHGYCNVAVTDCAYFLLFLLRQQMGGVESSSCGTKTSWVYLLPGIQ